MAGLGLHQAAGAALAVPPGRLVPLLAGPVITSLPVPHDGADGSAAAF